VTDKTGLTKRQRVDNRRAALIAERTTWLTHWREISEYQQPMLGRFLVTDQNRGRKRHNLIYDRTALGASRTLAAGMLSGMTSPARPWFRLSLADQDLSQSGPVKAWLHQTGVLIREIFNRSNTYRALQQGYLELGLFGTWADVILPDFDSVVHHYPMTIGEYALGHDAKGQINSFVREFKMTVGQLVEQFGRENCSTSVQNMYDRHQVDTWIPVCHLVEPRNDRDMRKADAKNMAFASIYFEASRDPDKDFLRESGFKRFPVLAPRWEVTGNDIYGTSPGMEALGDVKQLQHQQLRKTQAIDYQVNPPLQVPTQYKDAARHRLPGGVMYVDAATQGQGIRSAFEVNLDLNALREDIMDVRQRINSAYYADMFLMMANDTRSGVTATEIAERHEEKLLMLGPVLERLHNELLSPLIDITFDYAAEAGILPPAPPELEGMDLNIEFVSTLAQAQRTVSAQGMDRLLGSVGSLAGLFPQVIDKINPFQVIDDYADMYGVNPKAIVPTEDAMAAGEAKAKAAQAQAAMAQAPAMAQTAKAISGIDPGNMRDVMNQFQGYGSGPAV